MDPRQEYESLRTWLERLIQDPAPGSVYRLKIATRIWDADPHTASTRLGISRRSYYRHRNSSPVPVDEWLTESLDGGPDSAEPMAVTALYTYFDADDQLLYIGITDNLLERGFAHVRRSSWMEFATRSTIERFPTREAAEEEERKRIRALKPLFNSTHNVDPDAPRRLVEYLVKHGRTDLLAPAVSRG